VTRRDSFVTGRLRLLCEFLAMSHPEESAQAVKSEQMAPAASASAAAQQATSSCRKKKSESTTFFGEIVDHIDEFANASYDEHKTCLQKTLNKMFGMSKAVSNGTGNTSATVPVENVMSRPATTE